MLTPKLLRDNSGKALTIWYPPDPNDIYVMGVDTASGSAQKDGDDSAAIVLRASTLQEVASFRSSNLIPQEFAERVAALGYYYRGRARGGCLIVPETGQHGDVMIHVLRSTWNYPQVYAERRGRDFSSFEVKWGWASTVKSRQDMIDEAREHFKEVCKPEYLEKYGAPIRTKMLTEQIPKFIYDKKGVATTSKKRGHDDLIIAWGLAVKGKDEAMRRVEAKIVKEPEPSYESDVSNWVRQRVDEANRRIGIQDWRRANAESRELERLWNEPD